MAHSAVYVAAFIGSGVGILPARTTDVIDAGGLPRHERRQG